MPNESPPPRSRRIEHPVDGIIEVTEEVAHLTGTSSVRIAFRILFLVLAAVTLYGLAPRLINVWAELPRLRSIPLWWFPVLFALETTSLASLWWLIRIALPRVSWFVAATAQLSGNAVSKIVPGGGPMGAAIQYRMLSVAGVEPGSAATALGATGLLSAWILFALPFVALLVSLVGSPIPEGMSAVAWGGAFVFLVMFAAGLAIVRNERAIEVLGAPVERANHWVMARLGRVGGITVTGLREQREEMLETLGGSFRSALTAALGNWMLDYMMLVGALWAVGSRPRLSLVLLAYAVAGVLAMIPITPGGLGFVEAGLTATLTLAGVSSADALLATLAYRLLSYWLPLPAGLIAYLSFRSRYGHPPPEQDAGTFPDAAR